MGVALLVAATTVGAAGSATKKAGSAEAKKGGTLKLNEASEDFDFVDPKLAYRTDDWSMLFTTSAALVSFPEKSGAAGAQLYPWVRRRSRPSRRTARPTRSMSGRASASRTASR